MKVPLFGGLSGRKPPDASASQFRIEQLPVQFTGTVLAEYDVGLDHIYIVDENGSGKYIISEPSLTEDERRTYSFIMNDLYSSLPGSMEMEADPVQYIEKHIWEVSERLGIVDQVKEAYPKFKYFITRETTGYRQIDALISDPDVEEVSCVGPGKPVQVIQREFTKYDWLETNVVFGTEEALRNFVQKLAMKAGKNVTIAIPFTDAIMKEGHRVAVTVAGEVTLPGSTFAIRKFPKDPYSIASILKFGSMSPLMAAYYWLLIEYRRFTLVIGPMSSGKTSMINALATMIAPNMKIATIEDTPELNLAHSHWQRFKTRKTYSITESRFDVDLNDLTILSLRYRPDYIIVGEVRGAEISALVQAASLGHGCISSFHGDSPEAALVRMTTPPMNVQLGGQLLISSFLMMNRVRAADGSVKRRALVSKETVPDGDRLRLAEIFGWDAGRDTFLPDDPDEVVRRSRQLKSIMGLTGWDEARLSEELRKREKLLGGLVRDEKLGYRDVAEELTKFYHARYGLGAVAQPGLTEGEGMKHVPAG
jgi:flagellar protein FlaI